MLKKLYKGRWGGEMTGKCKSEKKGAAQITQVGEIYKELRLLI